MNEFLKHPNAKALVRGADDDPYDVAQRAMSSDEAKAMLQLVACLDAYPSATGLSHLMSLVIRDALRHRASGSSDRE